MKKFYAIITTVFVLGFIFLFVAKTNAVDNEVKHMPQEAKNCFVSKLGEAIFNEIITGQREPTAEEKQKAAACFQNMFKENKKIAVKGDVKACIKKNAGKNLEEIGELTDEQRTKINSCFVDAKTGAISFPNETRKCMISIVGETRANAIMENGEPTAEEKMAIGPKCFGVKPPKDAGMDKVSPEQQSCIQGITGKKMAQPTEEQKKEIGQKCFGGEMRDKAKEKMSTMNSEDKTCFTNVLGKSPEEMGRLTADQEKLIGEKCFSKSSSSGPANGPVSSSAGGPSNSQPQPENRPENQPGGQPGDQSGIQSRSNETPDSISRLKDATKTCIATSLGLTVATLGNADYNTAAVENAVATCKTANGEE